jgi:uncharacterized protein (TIGR03663 family)
MATGSTVSASAERVRGETRAFRVAAVAVLLLAAALRFYDLDLKPLHHDEGVNGHFLMNLYRQGVYRYDPANYHGPSLYYVSFVSAFLFGLNSIAVRLVPAFFGCVLVALGLMTRRWLGEVAALAGALFLAVSPGMVFYSRYFIHEMLLLAATLGAIVALRRFADAARLSDLLAAAAWAAWMFTTKETAAPTVVVLGAAVGCAWAYYALRHRRQVGPLASALSGLSSQEWVRLLTCAGALFGLINLLLYSSFFTNPGGILDAFRTLAFWTTTGVKEHVHPWKQHIVWIWQAEPALAVIGALGLLAALWRAESRFVLFLAAWTVGILMMYSIVPYKTPWLALNIVLPLALLAGYAIDVLVRRTWAWLGLGAVVVLALWLGIGRAEYMIGLWQSGKPLFIACALGLPLALLLLALGAGHALDVPVRRAWAWLGFVALVVLAMWPGTGPYPWTQSTIWLWQTEKPLVIACALGLLLALWRPENRLVVSLAACSIGTLAICGVVPSVKPWLAISIALPLALLAGYAFEVLARRRLTWLAALAVLVAATVNLRQAVDLNFVHYDDNSRPYIYAHTRREFLDMIAAVDRIATLSGQGEGVRIAIPAREHWPLPWYLRRYRGAAYEDVPANARQCLMVIGGQNQDAQIATSLGPTFERLGTFALRPGVDLVLFVRKDLAARAAVTP